MSEAASATTARPTHDTCAQLVELALIVFAGQSGHIVPPETEITLESISGIPALTSMSGSTVTSNDTSAAMTNTKRRIFSRAMAVI